MSDYDKQQWQAEQAARDAAIKSQREKWAKARIRAAKNAQRKIDRLSRKLAEKGELTDWEEEFTESVTERLDKFGSAFHDPEKGRPADALSFAQKKVVSALNKKARDAKTDPDGGAGKAYKTRKPLKARKGFSKKGFTPRVRQIEDDLIDESAEAFIPEIAPTDDRPPFLRIVK